MLLSRLTRKHKSTNSVWFGLFLCVSGSACAVSANCLTDRGGPACFFCRVFSEWKPCSSAGRVSAGDFHGIQNSFSLTQWKLYPQQKVNMYKHVFFFSHICGFGGWWMYRQARQHWLERVGVRRLRYTIFAPCCAARGWLQQQCDAKSSVRKSKLWRRIWFSPLKKNDWKESASGFILKVGTNL